MLERLFVTTARRQKWGGKSPAERHNANVGKADKAPSQLGSGHGQDGKARASGTGKVDWLLGWHGMIHCSKWLICDTYVSPQCVICKDRK